MEAGMDAYLSKPMRFGDLAAALDQCPCVRRVVPADEAAAPESFVCAEKISGFRQLEGDTGQDVLVSVIDLFIERTPPMFKEARRAVMGNDGPRVARLAHTLKGSCSNFGAQRMGAACDRLEAAAIGADMRNGTALVDDVEREFNLVRIALEHELEGKAS